MHTREIASEYRLSHWVRIMQARQESGLSIKALCNESGFHKNVYYYWQRKLRGAACVELATSEPVKALAPSGWARLEAAPAQLVIAVEINGCQVNVSRDIDPELLAQVCRILSTFFAYPPEIRKIIYTTNIIEGLNRQFRKVTKNKPSFTNDDSPRKLLYLASKKNVEHWTVRCRNWDQVIRHLDILFGDRAAG